MLQTQVDQGALHCTSQQVLKYYAKIVCTRRRPNHLVQIVGNKTVPDKVFLVNGLFKSLKDLFTANQ